MRVNEIIKDEKWTTLCFLTTWKNSWNMILSYASKIWEYTENAQVLVSPIAGIQPKTIDFEIAQKEDLFKIEENGVLVIRGLNGIYDHAPFQFTMYNQTDSIRLDIPTSYINTLKKNENEYLNDEEQKHTFDKFMDSIEIGGCVTDCLRREVPNALNAYVKALKQHNLINQDGANDIAYGWRDFRFPLDDVVSTIRDIDFVFEKNPADFLSISKEEMDYAHLLLENIISIKRNPEKPNMIDVSFYSGNECTNTGYLGIGSEEWNRKVQEKKENGKIANTQYNLNNKTIRSECGNPAHNCHYGQKCPRVIAAYLFYLEKIGKYEERMELWREAQATKPTDKKVAELTVDVVKPLPPEAKKIADAHVQTILDLGINIKEDFSRLERQIQDLSFPKSLEERMIAYIVQEVESKRNK